MSKRKTSKKEFSREKKLLAEEKRIEKQEKQIIKLEKNIKKKVTPKTVSRLTMQDFFKGVIGATFGIAAHFAFVEGSHIAENIDVLRAVLLIIFSYLLLTVMLYRTRFKKVVEHRMFSMLPLRATAIYLMSLAMIVIILNLFNMVSVGTQLELLFKQMAVLSLPASIGAGAADLIGEG